MWTSTSRSIQEEPHHHDGSNRQPGKRSGRTGSTEHEPDVRTSGDRRTGTGTDVPVDLPENTDRGEK
mgnify:CR=1 FL=1